MTTKIILKEKVPENAIVIEGFPSKGFVSTIAAKFTIEELQMKVIGYLHSTKLRSVALIHNSKPEHPIRIYAKDNIVLIFSELIIPFKEVPEISQSLDEFLNEIKPKEVILLAGISGKVSEEEHEILGLATSPELKEKLKNIGVKEVTEGMLTGISSDLLLFCYEQNIPAISLMAETKYIPDPLAAASMLKVLNKLLNVNINTEKLIKEGEQIEKMFKEVTDELKRGKTHYQQMEDFSPMYG